MPVVCCLLKNDLYSKLILESINMETISCEFEESQITHSAEVNDFQVTTVVVIDVIYSTNLVDF